MMAAMRRHAVSVFGVHVLIGLIVALTATPATAHAQSPAIRFGFQPWPGVTVKTEVASQLLNTLGYRTQQSQLGTSIILQGIANGDLDINLGIWYPLFADKYDPFVEKGHVARLATNLPKTTTGVAVPAYVQQAGVSSVTDLQRHPGEFGEKVYGIESGAAWNNLIEQTIGHGQYGLTDWQLIPSSTSGMLAQVGRAIKKNDWIVFHAWKPHWMNVRYDLRYLTAPKGSRIAQRHGSVYTVVTPDFSDAHPNVARLFRQFTVTAKIQSEWIFEHSFKDRAKEEVARQWISANMEIVSRWLQGVKTADGQPAMAAAQQEYGSS